MSRKSRIYLTIFVIIYWLTRIPFLNMGYGLDSDAWRIVRAAQHWNATGKYEMSRYPGFMFMEFVVKVLLKIDGCILTNFFVSLLGFLICLIVWDLIRRKLGDFEAFIGAITVALWGHFWISSVETMDIIPALFFGILSLWLLERGYSWIWAAISVGIGIGFRITTVLFVPVFMAMVYFKEREKKIGKTLGFAAVSLLPGALVYGYIFSHYGLGVPTKGVTILKILYHIYQFFGIWTVLVSIFVVIRFGRSLKNVAIKYWVYSALMLIILVFFARFPYDVNYLTPIAPLFVVFVSEWLSKHRTAYIILCVSIVLNSFVMLEVKSVTPVEEKLLFNPHLTEGVVLGGARIRMRGTQGIEIIKEWAEKLPKNEKVAIWIPHYMKGPIIIDDPQLEVISSKWRYTKRIKGTNVVLVGDLLDEQTINQLYAENYKFILLQNSVRDYDVMTGKKLLTILRNYNIDYEYVKFDQFNSFFS